MTDKLKEIKDRHEQTNKSDRCGWLSAHKDRHELLKMVDEQKAQLDAVREYHAAWMKDVITDFEYAHKMKALEKDK